MYNVVYCIIICFFQIHSLKKIIKLHHIQWSHNVCGRSVFEENIWMRKHCVNKIVKVTPFAQWKTKYFKSRFKYSPDHCSDLSKGRNSLFQHSTKGQVRPCDPNMFLLLGKLFCHVTVATIFYSCYIICQCHKLNTMCVTWFVQHMTLSTDQWCIVVTVQSNDAILVTENVPFFQHPSRGINLVHDFSRDFGMHHHPERWFMIEFIPETVHPTDGLIPINLISLNCHASQLCTYRYFCTPTGFLTL